MEAKKTDHVELRRRYGDAKVDKWLNSGALGSVDAAWKKPPPMPKAAAPAPEPVAAPVPEPVVAPKKAPLTEGSRWSFEVPGKGHATVLWMGALKEGELIVGYLPLEEDDFIMDAEPRSGKNARASALRRSRTNPGFWAVFGTDGLVVAYSSGKKVSP